MTDHEQARLALVRAYLGALESGASGTDFAQFFAPGAIQVELPNKLNPNGRTSDLATLLARSEQGRGILSSQKYEIVSELVQGSRAAVEATWSAVLAVQVGTLPAGSTMRAHFAMFFEFEGGKILTQRNYDCFEPW